MSSSKVIRCDWCGENPLYQAYHDQEWGKPVYDDRVLFEFLILEGAQAGLNWLTILKKREGYRKAFANFDPKKVAAFSAAKIDRLVEDQSIVRHRGKITSAVNNAKLFLQMQKQYGSFANFLWGCVDGKPIKNHWRSLADVPASTPLSDQIAKDLKKRGFKFVGTTIIYAYLQAVGVVDDHLVDCFCSQG